jgi:hypothetical protein
MALGLALSDGKVSKLAESLVVAMSCVAQYALPNLFESASNAAKRPCQRINERSCCSWHEATQSTLNNPRTRANPSDPG